MRYAVYQLPAGHPCAFADKDEYERVMGKNTMSHADYELVYEFYTKDPLDPELIFAKCNHGSPYGVFDGYKARSMSVSDLIERQDGKEIKLIFCDSFCWRETSWDD